MTIQQWKPGIFAALVLSLITSLPQLYLFYERGSNWNGAYANIDLDESSYSAYLNALIEGRPRRNDPYTGKDTNQFETLFSIQFVPAYFLAIPARLFNLSAATMFIVLLPLVTIAAALIIFRLLAELTEDVHLAAIGAVGVLCLGTAAAVNPIQLFLGRQSYDFFPFLRRYLPALPFPIFFAMCLFTWRALTRHILWAVLAAISLAVLVYSYFYLWTAGVSWLCVIVMLWFIYRKYDRKRVWGLLVIVTAIGAVAIIPYVWLLTRRAATMDRTQILEMTHSPDLFRGPELYGFLSLMALGYLVKRQVLSLQDPKTLFTISFLIAPFIVFNQQIFTGRSLQPFHYEYFIANYCVVLAAFLIFGIAWLNMPRRIQIYLALGSLILGLMIGIRTTQITIKTSARLDEGRGIALYLKERDRTALVFSSSSLLMDIIPTATTNPVLWAPHLSAFSTLDPGGLKKRFYQSLYYRGLSEQQFALALHSSSTERVAIFGAERADPALTSSHRPITEEEINSAAREYREFSDSFEISLAGDPVLSYAIVSADDNLSNLDRWYTRTELRNFGDFTIYSVRLRHEVTTANR